MDGEAGRRLAKSCRGCHTVPVAMRTKPYRTEVLLKVMGAWTTLWLEERQPDVFVLYDR